MECVRQIVDSELLDRLQLPQALRNRKVEVIIMPVESNTDKKGKKAEETFGILHKYANPALLPIEKDAWGMAVSEKYADR